MFDELPRIVLKAEIMDEALTTLASEGHGYEFDAKHLQAIQQNPDMAKTIKARLIDEGIILIQENQQENQEVSPNFSGSVAVAMISDNTPWECRGFLSAHGINSDLRFLSAWVEEAAKQSTVHV